MPTTLDQMAGCMMINVIYINKNMQHFRLKYDAKTGIQKWAKCETPSHDFRKVKLYKLVTTIRKGITVGEKMVCIGYGIY